MSKKSDSQEITKTEQGNPVLRKNLKLMEFNGGVVVYDQQTCTMLCFVVEHLDVEVSHPVTFMNATKALEWIKEGCISELQISLSTLRVIFTNRLMRPPARRRHSREKALKGYDE